MCCFAELLADKIAAPVLPRTSNTLRYGRMRAMQSSNPSHAIETNPELVKNAPHTTPVSRLDEVGAAKELNISYPLT